MSATISGTLVTQTAGTTDTSWDFLNGMAGVTRLQTGDGFLYYAPTLGINIAGTVTIADPSKSTVICNFLRIQSTGIYTSGTFAADGVTPLRTGTHFCTTGPGLNVATVLTDSAYGAAASGRSTLIGGDYFVSGSIFYTQGAVIREYEVSKFPYKAFGASQSVRIRAFSSDVILRNCKHYDISYDLFRMPTEFSVQAFGAEYLSQYVGSGYGGADAKYTAYNPLNVDGAFEFDNYGAGWVELYNSQKGASLLVVIQNADPVYKARHAVPLFQEINFKVTNLLGANIQNARFRCVDAPVSNTPTTTITTTGSLKTWDFRNPLTYTGTTDANGVASSAPILQVWWGQSNVKNLRFPSSTASYQFRTYDYQTQDTSIVLGSDSAIAKGMAVVPLLTPVTVTEAVAGAITGIAFAPAGATGGTITISENRTLQDVWNYYRYWVSQFANWGSTDTWTCSNGLLNIGAWSLAVNAGVSLSKTSAISRLQSTSTITVSGTTDASYTDNTGTRVNIVERTGKAISTYVTINGVPVGGTTVDGTFRAGWVPMATSRTITVQPTDQVRFSVASYGYKPAVVNALGSELDKFTVSLETEPAGDKVITDVLRQEIADCFASLQNGQTIEVTINKTLIAYTPDQVISGFAYYLVSKGYLIAGAIVQSNNANLYAITTGTIISYSPAYKLRMADLDANGVAITPSVAGYSIPLVVYYQDPATGVKSGMTLLNPSGAYLCTAPWPQSQASVGDADQQAIAAKTKLQIEASTVLAKEATVQQVKTRANDLPTLVDMVGPGTTVASQDYSVAILDKVVTLPNDIWLDQTGTAYLETMIPMNVWAYAGPEGRTLTAGGVTLAQIEASSVLAKEATVASRASQTSVNAVQADVAAVPASVWAQPVETGQNATATMRLMSAVLLGKVSGAGTGTEVFRDVNDTKPRVTATVDAQGNRTAITRDAS